MQSLLLNNTISIFFLTHIKLIHIDIMVIKHYILREGYSIYVQKEKIFFLN